MTETVLALINSPAFVAVLVAILLIILDKVFDKRPTWKVRWAQFSPVFISAVKLAEKQIPDDTPNKGLARLDYALKYTLKVIEGFGIPTPDKKGMDEIRLNIEEAHALLESQYVLAQHEAKNKQDQ